MSTSSAKRILFMDDEPEHVKYYVRVLENSGYTVELINSSTAGLDLCVRAYGGEESGDSGYSLLVLDMMMPPPSGVHPAEVDAGLATGAYILREHHRHCPYVPVLILSNLNEGECIDAIFRVCRTVLPGMPAGVARTDVLAFLRSNLSVTICEKRRTPPFLLPVRVEELIGSA